MTSKVASQRQVLATISVTEGQTGLGIPVEYINNHKFAQVSGGEISASVEKVYRGGTFFPEVLCAPAEIGDITLTDFHEYDSPNDAADGQLYNFMQKVRQYVGRVYFDLSIKTYDCDIAQPGSERKYVKCLLVGVTEADGDSSSGTPSTFALTFSVSGITPVS